VTIQEIHNYILFVLDKDAGGFVSSAEIDIALDRSQMSIFRHYLGNTREYQPGRPVPRAAYGITSTVDEALYPFKAQVTATPSGGAATFNFSSLDDIMAIISASSSTDEIEIVNEEEFHYRRTSKIHSPALTGPVSRLYDYNKSIGTFKLQVLPASFVSAITIDVLRRPVQPSLSGSVTLEWKEPQLNEIMNEAIKILSVNTQNVPAFQFGNAQVTTGS
jgi:hypothetical protein